MGTRAFGNSSGLAVNVVSDTPGPHNITAWKPGAGMFKAWGILQWINKEDFGYLGTMVLASRQIRNLLDFRKLKGVISAMPQAPAEVT